MTKVFHLKINNQSLPYLARVLAVTLVVAGLATSAFYFEKERFLERAEISTKNIASLQSQNIRNLFDKIDVALQAGALFHLHQQMSGPFKGDEIDEYLRRLEAVIPEIDAIRIADEEGLVKYGHDVPTNPRINLSDRAYFIKARDDSSSKNALIIDGPLLTRISQKWAIVFAHRLSKPDGSFAGVIYANLATNQFQTALSSVALGFNGAATIRTTSLALVHRVPELKGSIGDTKVSSQLREAITTSPLSGEYIAVTALDGIERSNAYLKVGDYPFYVIAGIATQAHLGSYPQNALIILILSGAIIIISAIGSHKEYVTHQLLASDLFERNQLNDTLHKALDERDNLYKALTLKAEEAESASKAKSAFLSNMSHELRTPLHQIQGLLSLIKKEPLTSKQAERMGPLESCVLRMTALVDAVLELTKIEADPLNQSETHFALGDLVHSAVEKYLDEAAGKHLIVNIHDIPEIEGGLVGDLKHLKQALMNYLSNAVRFTEVGTIDVRVQVVRETDRHVQLRFEVQDTGVGIKPADQHRLFNIFEQVDNSTTRQHGGLGVGLAMTRKIAKGLNGDAGFESAEGNGSTFWFTATLKKMTDPVCA